MPSTTILTYSSRSGSTFLARELSRAFDIVVVPEFQLAYPALSLGVGARLGSKHVRRLVEDDQQLDWIAPGDVDSLIGDGSVTPGELIGLVARQYAESVGSESEDYLIKLGGLALLWPQVRKHLPGVRALNVIRDGRAVVNSLISSSSPYLTGRLDMGYGDPVWSARTWLRDVETQLRCVDQFPGAFHSYRYEDVIRAPHDAVRQIGRDFGWREGASGRTSFGVAKAERAIHRNIEGPALESRISGWMTELSADDRIVVEEIAERGLASLGYGNRLEVAPEQRAQIMRRAMRRHALRQGIGWMHRLRRLNSSRDVVDRVRRRVVRRVAWRR